jgi:uncharacterized protein YutE (UPF0331/DUF86 family)
MHEDANTFEILNRSGLISDGLAETMIRMAKFRNIVVHRYSDVDGYRHRYFA